MTRERESKEFIVLTEGKYTIKRDCCNFTLYKTTKAKTGVNAGKEVDTVIGYHGSLAQAIQKMSDDILDGKLKYNKDKTIDGIVAVLERHMKEINKKFGTEINK